MEPLGNTFSSKSSPNVWWHLGHLSQPDVVTFLGNFFRNLGNFLFQHLVTHTERKVRLEAYWHSPSLCLCSCHVSVPQGWLEMSFCIFFVQFSAGFTVQVPEATAAAASKLPFDILLRLKTLFEREALDAMTRKNPIFLLRQEPSTAVGVHWNDNR